MTFKKACAVSVVTSALVLGWLAPGWAGPKANKTPPSEPGNSPANNEDVAAPQAGDNLLLGTYVGQFGTHRITICLQNIVDNTVNGYSVVAGNERAFSGSIHRDPDGYSIAAQEPGDHPQDGRFRLSYQLSDKHLVGTWTPNDQKNLSGQRFDLVRRDFKYDPKLGTYPQASTRPLKTADVQNLRPDELRIMRNEMYARHGYTFRLREMREHFEGQDWYMPINFNVVNQLTPVEQRNETLIKKYENYGAENYDAFGR